MKITKESIQEYRQIYKKEFQQEISFEEAAKQAQDLLQFLSIILK
jgi:hypothetical protein